MPIVQRFVNLFFIIFSSYKNTSSHAPTIYPSVHFRLKNLVRSEKKIFLCLCQINTDLRTAEFGCKPYIAEVLEQLSIYTDKLQYNSES